jgi:hypothetical protein
VIFDDTGNDGIGKTIFNGVVAEKIILAPGSGRAFKTGIK